MASKVLNWSFIINKTSENLEIQVRVIIGGNPVSVRVTAAAVSVCNLLF